jgi:hypothetical protein
VTNQGVAQGSAETFEFTIEPFANGAIVWTSNTRETATITSRVQMYGPPSKKPRRLLRPHLTSSSRERRYLGPTLSGADYPFDTRRFRDKRGRSRINAVFSINLTLERERHGLSVLKVHSFLLD